MTPPLVAATRLSPTVCLPHSLSLAFSPQITFEYLKNTAPSVRAKVFSGRSSLTPFAARLRRHLCRHRYRLARSFALLTVSAATKAAILISCCRSCERKKEEEEGHGARAPNRQTDRQQVKKRASKSILKFRSRKEEAEKKFQAQEEKEACSYQLTLFVSSPQVNQVFTN